MDDASDKSLEAEFIENADDDVFIDSEDKVECSSTIAEQEIVPSIEDKLDSILDDEEQLNSINKFIGTSGELQSSSTVGHYFTFEAYSDVINSRTSQRIHDIVNGYDTNPYWLPTGRKDPFMHKSNNRGSISTPTSVKSLSLSYDKQSTSSVQSINAQNGVNNVEIPEEKVVELDSWGLPKLTDQEMKVLLAVRRLKAKGLWNVDPKSLYPSKTKAESAYYIDFAIREQRYIAREQRSLVKYQRKMKKGYCSAFMKHVISKQKPNVDPEEERQQLAKEHCSEISSMIESFWKKQRQLFEIYETRIIDEVKKKKREDQLMSVIDRSSALTKLMIPGTSTSDENIVEADDVTEDLDDMDKFLKSLPKEYLQDLANKMPEESETSFSENDTTVNEESEPETPVRRRSLRSKSISSISSKEDLSVKAENGIEVERRRSPRRPITVHNNVTETLSPNNVENNISVPVSQTPAVNGNLSPSKSTKTAEITDSEMNDLAKIADSFRPTGSTYETAKVNTVVPSILDAKLREYQHIGLDWLVSLFNNKLNGILADEMGLGKTVQTISFLAYLTEEKKIWGPHLIVVPTSVLLNWEREFKRFCPSLKVLTYFGSTKERAEKRKGWKKPNSFNVCITTYDLYIKDTRMFKWRAWQCLVLDEAHNIKNSKSLRWNKLLSLRTRIRVLLTGTPLQNNLMELWSLLYFLMPSVFASQEDFKNWFNDPMNAMIEGSVEYNARIIDKLHTVLRPFILRRLKSEVEKQMPLKLERVVYCPLSRLQRNLYNAFLRQRTTIDSIKGGSAVSIMNIVMQLRKCCNHPNLFIPITCKTPIKLQPLSINYPLAIKEPEINRNKPIMDIMNGDFINIDNQLNNNQHNNYIRVDEIHKTINFDHIQELSFIKPRIVSLLDLSIEKTKADTDEQTKKMRWLWNVTKEIRDSLNPSLPQQSGIFDPCKIKIMSNQEKLVQKYGFAPFDVFSTVPNSNVMEPVTMEEELWYDEGLNSENDLTSYYHYSSLVECHDPRLVEIDCGKLRMLSKLLRQLKLNGHRCLIFTQMSKMLDILEIFLTYQKHMYFRLDGSTPIQQRQVLMDRFNADERVFVFILSTRSGGIGMNLTGADTVIFYDSDWNPTMDAQAQDRCHRIGQTRNVMIYRLISASTIEENILKRAFHKRKLGEMTLDEANFTPAFADKSNVRELFEGEEALQDVLDDCNFTVDKGDIEKVLSKVEDVDDVKAAEELRKEIGEEAALVEDEFEDMIQNQLSSVERWCFNFYRDEHKHLIDEKLREFENVQDPELSTNASDVDMASEDDDEVPVITSKIPSRKRSARTSAAGPNRKRVRFSTSNVKTRAR